MNKEIAELDTPGELEDEALTLNVRLDATISDLKNIAKAARNKDAEDAAAATVELAADSQRVNTAQNNLAKATGADIGDR